MGKRSIYALIRRNEKKKFKKLVKEKSKEIIAKEIHKAMVAKKKAQIEEAKAKKTDNK